MNKQEYFNNLKAQNLIMSVHLKYVLHKINSKEKILRWKIKEIEQCLEDEEKLLEINK